MPESVFLNPSRIARLGVRARVLPWRNGHPASRGPDRPDVRQRRVKRLGVMYERLRTRHAGEPGIPQRPAQAGALPTIPEIDAVENAALHPPGRDTFLHALLSTGDLAPAAIQLVRDLLHTDARAKARSIAQIFHQQDGLEAVGDICQGLIALQRHAPTTAWPLLSRHTASALRLAPGEFFRAGFQTEPGIAAEVLEEVARGRRTVQADPGTWLDIAQSSLAADAEDLSRFAFDHALAGLPELGDTPGAQLVHQRLSWLETWYGRGRAVPAALGQVSFAVTGFRRPELGATSNDLGPYFETLATLTQLVRRTGVRLAGTPELVGFGRSLRARVAPDRRLPGDDVTARLCEVDRDAARYAEVPKGTWLVACGPLPHPTYRIPGAVPLDPRLRPVFLSVHVDSAGVLTAEMLGLLRRFGPVGCRDWSTVLLLQAADVPAFFAGPITATLGDLAVEGTAEAPPLFVDVGTPPGGEAATQELDEVRTRDLVGNLGDALQRLGTFAGRRVTTSQLQTYLAARAVGAAAKLRPANAAARRLDGLLGLKDGEFGALRDGLRDRLGEMYGLILSGAAEGEVYARWRELCAPDVARAAAERAKVSALPPPSFDVARACATIRHGATVVERSQVGPDGAEINVEFSLDGNYKPQLEVVLDSIVTHASRPIRAYVLCRDHTWDDYDRMARLFPTVSFVWLPTDGVDYGPISGLLGYTTVATMDRLLLPELLPEVGRIIHHDLDALCLVDLAELDDVDLEGTPLAARTSPHPNLVSGFAAFMRQSERFRYRPHLGREYRRRTHLRHQFDFRLLNAGVMVLDLDRMRADGFCREFLPYVERFGMHDQVILNIYAGANRVELAPGWNWRPWLEQLDEPKIAHWCGQLKPWGEIWVNGKDLWQRAEARMEQRRRSCRPTAAATAAPR